MGRGQKDERERAARRTAAGQCAWIACAALLLAPALADADGAVGVPPPGLAAASPAGDDVAARERLYAQQALTVRQITVYSGRARRWTEYRPWLGPRALDPVGFFTLTGDAAGLRGYRRGLAGFGIMIGLGAATAAAGIGLGAAGIADRMPDGSIDQRLFGTGVALFVAGGLTLTLSTLAWPRPFRSQRVAEMVAAYNAGLRARLGLP